MEACVNYKSFVVLPVSAIWTLVNVLCVKPSANSLTHPKCKKRNSLDEVFTAVEYRTVTKKAVENYRHEPYIFNLSGIFSRLIYESLIQNEIFQNILFVSSNVWITCVPLHEKKRMKRGYNQNEKLAQNLAEKLGLSFNSKLIIRTRNTIPQFKLKKEEKEKNIAGAFSLNPKYKGKMSGKSIFR